MAEVQRQLAMIGELQRHLLPRHIPQPEGWLIRGHYAAGRWPGGDYYDFLPLPDGRLLMLLAHASEVGAPAVALTAMLRVILHSCPLSSGVERVPFCPLQGAVLQPPHLLLARLNEVLVENSLEEQFMTAFCALVDPAEGNIHYASAAHAAPLWWRQRLHALEELPGSAGLPLGLQRHVSYHHRRARLEVNDVLVLFSDGLVSAQNAAGQVFGRERVETIVRQGAGRGGETVKLRILDELEVFLRGNPPAEDLLLLVLERRL